MTLTKRFSCATGYTCCRAVPLSSSSRSAYLSAGRQMDAPSLTQHTARSGIRSWRRWKYSIVYIKIKTKSLWREVDKMKFLVITNGAYGDLDWYRSRIKVNKFEKKIVVDGGAGRARELGIIPDWVVGDMDSISEHDRRFMEEAGVCFELHPVEKDFTDTQIALELVEREGGRKIEVWGG